ncbi:protein phosphatase 1 regulatory subunit 12A [Anopheles cruzii]|uniref:protein phosphatase 1 regulatory subunit 12A n=1 Tax=Anopheles cruzii TaxID=68878 RepID=UPI0022EC4E2B|nr:protein phosphatase 1 regulatory subunit 12A [Anopheles cruzii]
MSLDNRNTSAQFKRAEQLKRWEESEINKKASGIPKSPSSRRIKFSSGCIFLAACVAGDKDEVEWLLKNGADIDTANVDGLTALHQACIDDNLDMVEFLIQKGADVNRKDNEGWTPLHATASCGFLSIARYLIENGADLAAINSDGELAVDLANSDAMEDMIQHHNEEQGIDCEEARQAEERIMLNDATRWLRTDSSDCDKVHPKTGATAIHVAAAKGYNHVLKLLLEGRGDFDRQDVDGWTPLHAAAYWGQKEATQMLLDQNADVDIQNFSGQLAIDIAQDDIVPLLKDARKNAKRTKRRPPSRCRITDNFENITETPTKVIRVEVKPSRGDEKEEQITSDAEEVVEEGQEECDAKQEEMDGVEEEEEEHEGEEEEEKEERPIAVEEPLGMDVPEMVIVSRTKQKDPEHFLCVRYAMIKQTEEEHESESDEEEQQQDDASVSSEPYSSSNPSADSSLTESETEVSEKENQPTEPDVILRRTQSFENDEKFYQKYAELRARIQANACTHALLPPSTIISNTKTSTGSNNNNNNSATTTTTPASNNTSYLVQRSASLKDYRTLRKTTSNLVLGSTTVTPAATIASPATPSVAVAPTVPSTASNTSTNVSSPTSPSGTSTTTPTSGQIRRSFVPPTRDEESETQRKAHAKRVRETRRSTQGVTLDEIKSAEQLVKKKNNVVGTESDTTASASNAVTIPSSSTSSSPSSLSCSASSSSTTTTTTTDSSPLNSCYNDRVPAVTDVDVKDTNQVVVSASFTIPAPGITVDSDERGRGPRRNDGPNQGKEDDKREDVTVSYTISAPSVVGGSASVLPVVPRTRHSDGKDPNSADRLPASVDASNVSATFHVPTVACELSPTERASASATVRTSPGGGSAGDVSSSNNSITTTSSSFNSNNNTTATNIPVGNASITTSATTYTKRSLFDIDNANSLTLAEKLRHEANKYAIAAADADSETLATVDAAGHSAGGRMPHRPSSVTNNTNENTTVGDGDNGNTNAPTDNSAASAAPPHVVPLSPSLRKEGVNTVPVTTTTTAGSGGGNAATERRPSWRLKVDNGSKFKLEDVSTTTVAQQPTLQSTVSDSSAHESSFTSQAGAEHGSVTTRLTSTSGLSQRGQQQYNGDSSGNAKTRPSSATGSKTSSSGTVSSGEQYNRVASTTESVGATDTSLLHLRRPPRSAGGTSSTGVNAEENKENDKENDSRTAQATQAVIQRRRRQKRRSTGVVPVGMEDLDPDRQDSPVDGDEKECKTYQIICKMSFRSRSRTVQPIATRRASSLTRTLPSAVNGTAGSGYAGAGRSYATSGMVSSSYGTATSPLATSYSSHPYGTASISSPSGRSLLSGTNGASSSGAGASGHYFDYSNLSSRRDSYGGSSSSLAYKSPYKEKDRYGSGSGKVGTSTLGYKDRYNSPYTTSYDNGITTASLSFGGLKRHHHLSSNGLSGSNTSLNSYTPATSSYFGSGLHHNTTNNGVGRSQSLRDHERRSRSRTRASQAASSAALTNYPSNNSLSRSYSTSSVQSEGYETGSERGRSRVGSTVSEADTASGSKQQQQQNSSRENGGDFIDYKALYEQEKAEKEKLKMSLRKKDEEVVTLKAALDRFTTATTKNNSLSELEKRERRAMERKMSEMEEELKQLEALKTENQRLKDENGALIRVISKLSR